MAWTGLRIEPATCFLSWFRTAESALQITTGTCSLKRCYSLELYSSFGWLHWSGSSCRFIPSQVESSRTVDVGECLVSSLLPTCVSRIFQAVMWLVSCKIGQLTTQLWQSLDAVARNHFRLLDSGEWRCFYFEKTESILCFHKLGYFREVLCAKTVNDRSCC